MLANLGVNALQLTVDGMASKGLRSVNLSRYT